MQAVSMLNSQEIRCFIVYSSDNLDNKIMTTGLAGGLLCGYKPLFLLASKEALNSPPSALRSQAWL